MDGDRDGTDGMGKDGWIDTLCVYVCEGVPVTTCNTMHTVVLCTRYDIGHLGHALSEEERERARVGGKGRKQKGQGRSCFCYYFFQYLHGLNRVLIVIECRRVSFSTFSSCCPCWQWVLPVGLSSSCCRLSTFCVMFVLLLACSRVDVQVVFNGARTVNGLSPCQPNPTQPNSTLLFCVCTLSLSLFLSLGSLL